MTFSEALGRSDAFLDLQERISRAAQTDRPVILIGERGTGKELAAARLHRLSSRWKSPYITLNCASLAPTLIESELFGHEAGAFTGAARRRKGRFEMADGGSLFLDEAGNIPMTEQEKILRVVEYGTLERVGGSESLHVDARIIAATNADLREMSRRGTFREDLLDRLSFEVITLPPLRARKEDIPFLAGHFARRMALELAEDSREDTTVIEPEFSPQAMDALMEYPWPGNIRELKNVVERMVYRARAEHQSTGSTRTESRVVIHEVVFNPFASEDASTQEIEKHAVVNISPPTSSILPSRRKPRATQRKWAAQIEYARRKADEKGNGPETFLKSLETLPIEAAMSLLEKHRLEMALQQTDGHFGRAAESLGVTYAQFRRILARQRNSQ